MSDEVIREIQTGQGEFEAFRCQEGTFRLRRISRDDSAAETKAMGETHEEAYASLDEAEQAAYAKYGRG